MLPNAMHFVAHYLRVDVAIGPNRFAYTDVDTGKPVLPVGCIDVDTGLVVRNPTRAHDCVHVGGGASSRSPFH